MMKKCLVITFSILTIICNPIIGQDNKESETQPGELYLKLKSINFIKNNEYFNPVIEGYTLIGYFIRPEIVYSPTRKITLRLGTHLLNYAGADKLSQFRPVFSTSMNFSECTSLTIGTLSGSDKHHMFDPHFNMERLYTEYSEDGLQFLTSSSHFFSDTWISWENFIFKGDLEREIFTTGESFNYISSPIAENIHVEVPVQIQLKHFGGQISNYPEHVETYFNLATGININVDIAQKRFGMVGVKYLQFINNEFPSVPESGITHGYASWLRLNYIFKSLNFGADYWKSHNFFAPNGNRIYSSVSDYQNNVIIPNRNIITNYFNLTVFPESFIELFLGLETYYDLDRKNLDYAMTLHLNFEKLIRLATLKQ